MPTRNNFMFPYGSIQETIDSMQSDTTVIRGKGGSARHGANFSDGNPYAEQLQYATNNKDIDALYAQAIEWEADHANLQEQRAYEDPVAQIARQRAAGINPDIAGASVGGGSSVSSGSSAQIADQNADVKYNNAYDNTQQVFDGINTVMNVIGTMTNLGTAVGNLVSTFRMLPHQQNLIDAQANLANVQAEQLPQQVQNQTEAVQADVASQKADTELKEQALIAQRLGYVGKSVEVLKTLGVLVTKNMSESQTSSLLSACGIPVEEQATTLEAIRAIQENPALASQFEADQLAYTKNRAANAVMTEDLVKQILRTEVDADLAENGFKAVHFKLKTGLENFLKENGYVQKSGESILGELDTNIQRQGVTQQNLELFGKQLTHDTEVFDKQIKYCKSQADYARAQLNQYLSDTSGRELTNADYAIIQGYKNRIMRFETMTSNNIHTLYKSAQDLLTSTYMSYLMTDDGSITGVTGLSNDVTFLNAVFDAFVQVDFNDPNLTQRYVSSVLNCLGSLINTATHANSSDSLFR